MTPRSEARMFAFGRLCYFCIRSTVRIYSEVPDRCASPRAPSRSGLESTAQEENMQVRTALRSAGGKLTCHKA
jgi:hypothetical protein